MLRRMATSAAATALVLSVSLPALADHAQPDETLDGNVKSCVGLVDGAYWEKSADVPKEIQHPWWTVTIATKSLDVKLTPEGVSADAQLAVLVKGGNRTNLFLGEPGEDLRGLFAPVNASGQHADISNYTICKVEPKAPPSEPPPSEEPPTEVPPTKEPAEPPATETPPAGGGEPTPTASKTPVPVPTSVPAGLNVQPAGLGADIVAALAVAILAVGAAVLGRRLSA